MLLFGKLLLVLLAVVITVVLSLGITWIWLSHEHIANLISPQPGLSFDYIIVGAGTAGSVLAHELSQNSNQSVLLIEAGNVFSPLSKVPLLAVTLQRTKHDWEFKSVPQKYSSFGLHGQVHCHPRGKGLGGSAQINFMLHFNGNQKDFDRWYKMGIKGWSLRTQKSYSELPSSCSNMICGNALACELNRDSNSIENQFCYQTHTNPKNNSNADEIWTIPQNYSPISMAFVQASRVFENEGLHFRLSKYNIRNGVRWSVYEKFLKPSFGRTNLKILLDTYVKKINIEGGGARSVIIENIKMPNRKFEIHARKEIAISAGTYQSPQLLQISGIGPKNLLDGIGVKQVIHSKNVGLNLHDHFHLPLFVSINVTASLTAGKILNPREIYKYLTTGAGHFSNFGVIGDITSENDHSVVTIFGTGAIDERVLMDVSNFKREDFRSLFPLYHNSSQEGFVMISSCLQPQSRGSVKAATSNIEDPPLIDPRYAQNRQDIACTINSVRNGVKLLASKPFREIGVKIHWPKVKSCNKFGPLNRDFYTITPSDKYLECLIRTVGLTGHHPGGTCSMGGTSDSVVDNQLRVRGIDRLRVVDASILPTPISGTPNSIIVAIAKKAAKLILRDT